MTTGIIIVDLKAEEIARHALTIKRPEGFPLYYRAWGRTIVIHSKNLDLTVYSVPKVSFPLPPSNFVICKDGKGLKKALEPFLLRAFMNIAEEVE